MQFFSTKKIIEEVACEHDCDCLNKSKVYDRYGLNLEEDIYLPAIIVEDSIIPRDGIETTIPIWIVVNDNVAESVYGILNCLNCINTLSTSNYNIQYIRLQNKNGTYFRQASVVELGLEEDMFNSSVLYRGEIKLKTRGIKYKEK